MNYKAQQKVVRDQPDWWRRPWVIDYFIQYHITVYVHKSFVVQEIENNTKLLHFCDDWWAFLA